MAEGWPGGQLGPLWATWWGPRLEGGRQRTRRAHPVEISDDTIRSSLRLISDDDLLKRWSQGQFSDQASPIALAEIERRGMDVSTGAVQRMKQRETLDDKAVRRRQKAVVSRVAWRLILGVIGTAGAAIAALFFAAIH